MRKAGVLMPVASLPNRYGVGDFGPQSYKFVDLLEKTNVSIWQILPLNPLGYGSSPYQPYSSKAMDEIYLSLDTLYEEGLIKQPKAKNARSTSIDYEVVRAYKSKYFKEAYSNFKKTSDYYDFGRIKWVKDYCTFLCFKKLNDYQCWNKWRSDMRDHPYHPIDLAPYQDLIDYEIFIQYQLYKQWHKLKKYANDRNINIMGDIPFYVGIDSDDVWMNKECFLLDEDNEPTCVAGVPPDYFNSLGQRWGNPIYNWEYLEKTNFDFLIERLAYCSDTFNVVRIDHFKAFDTYYSIPSYSETAEIGEFFEAPGYAFFDTLFEKYPDINIVVEDLGTPRQELFDLIYHYDFMGMKVVQFHFFSSEEVFQREHVIMYTGTHDNESLENWFTTISGDEKARYYNYFEEHGYNHERITDNFIESILKGKSEIVIMSIVDMLDLPITTRINTPGTVGSPNWEFRITSYKLFEEKVKFIRNLIQDSNRAR